MLDHLIITVSDVDRSLEFYAKALIPLGITNYVNYSGENGHADLKGFGKEGRAFFWIKKGVPGPQSTHFAFPAQNREGVREFYAAAMKAGGIDNDSPRPRLEYDANYYAAYVLDPDGYNIEAVYKGEDDDQ